MKALLRSALLHTTVTGFALSSLLAAGIASAQTRTLEEIVVTAQKRAQSVQDIPLAVSAISAETIAKLGIVDTTELVRLAPSLTVAQGDNKQNSSFRLRGIGTDVFSIGVEQSVAFIVDDVAAVQAGQAISNLVDIERIEILRGPQSTLFGKSASAGVVNIVTKAPTETFEGSIELTATDDEEYKVLAAISGPVSDNLGYRLTGHWSDREGYINNLSIGEDVNDNESKGLRGKLQWSASETVEADFSAYWSKEETTCCALTWLDLDPDAKVFGIVPGEIAEGITPSDENYDFRSEDGPVDSSENSGANVRVNIDLNDFILTSITAYDNWEYANDGDVDFSNVDVFGFFTGGAVQGGFFSESDTETDFISQEFRLQSPSFDNYDYLIGAYYAKAETDRSFLRNPGLPIIPSDWSGVSETESYALFGQFTWRFTEATSVTGGLRFNNEDISVDYLDQINSPDQTVSGDDSDSEVLGSLSLQHFSSDEVMFYARYAQGYKGQAYDITSGFTQVKADNPVAPETSDSYEIGVKSTLWDQRLLLNATAFYTKYEDYQAQSTAVTPDGELVVNINNVGELETQGIELESKVLLGDSLTLAFNTSYIDAVVKSFEGANCFPGQTEAQGCSGGTQDIVDGELPNAPEWKYSIIADYSNELGDMSFYGFINFSYTWQDDLNFSLNQNPLTKHDSYGVANLNLGINEKASDRYRVTLFVNNLTDENYRSGIGDLRQLYGGATSLTNIFGRGSQRYAGVRLKFNF